MSKPLDFIPLPIRQAAAEWRVRHDAGMSEAQEGEFAAWLDADERHAIAFGDIDDTYRALTRLSGQRPEGAPDPDLLKPAEVVDFRLVRPVVGTRLIFASVAAAMVLVALGLWRFGLNASSTPSALTTDRVQQLTLDDGSLVQLNIGSRLEVHYTKRERRVRLLQGEAHFSVAKNPDQPFLVEVRGVTVRALGTAFNVRSAASEVEVLVTEGRVSVSDGNLAADRSQTKGAQVGAGEKVRVPAQSPFVVPLQVIAVSASEVDRSLAWHDRRLKFVDVTLAEAVHKFNLHNRHRLVIADPELDARRFGGTFFPESYDAFVRLLETDFDVVAERREGETVLRRAR